MSHHQMAVDEDVRPHAFPDVLDERGSERDGPIDHPIAIHDVQMNPIDTGRNGLIHGLSDLAEICGENAWSDDHERRP